MIVLPILAPLLFAIVSLVGWSKPAYQRVVGIVGAVALNGVTLSVFAQVRAGGIQVAQVGNWPAPFGITLAVDLFGAVMLQVSALVALTVAIFSLSGIDDSRVKFGFYPLFFVLLMGVNGAFTTGDLFNLYVWFEVMLMASFVLIALGGERAQIEGAVKYVILNLLSSTLFLSAIGLLYNLTGTLNMADLALRMPEVQPAGEVTLIAVLFLIAFGIKSAIFPLFFWLPASYHTPPVVITALFSGLLTKVGVFALTRVFTLLFITDFAITQPILLVLAGLTMVVGVLGAAVQTDFRRLLSFHIISQIGYLLMGLGLGSAGALAGVVFFMVHVILAKTALFLVAGLVERLQGSFDLKKLGGLASSRPWLALIFLIPALSLAGLPPLSGFFAKLVLVQAGLELRSFLVTGAALGVSLLTFYSMTKVWNEVFWKDRKSGMPALRRAPVSMWVAVISLAAISLLAGLAAGPLVDVSLAAGIQLADPAAYISAVMGGIGGAP
ncbi:MAG: Na+/H+ antiporter subunit D [Anaerolineaceae bacterium]|nr:Na+/H+ antiporter subunit D [Anaerolineaceae bacterium]